MAKNRRLLDEYRFPGFRPRSQLQGIFGDPHARVIRLQRRQKKRSAGVAGEYMGAITTGRCGGSETLAAETSGFTWRWKSAGSFVGSAGR